MFYVALFTSAFTSMSTSIKAKTVASSPLTKNISTSLLTKHTSASPQTPSTATPPLAQPQPSRKRFVFTLALLASTLYLPGCATKPVYQQANSRPSIQVDAQGVPNYYQVRAGDTISQIARRYGLNYRQVGAINGLDSRYTIYAGQWLRLWNGAVNNGATSYNAAVSTPSQTLSRGSSPATATINRPVSSGNDGYVATVKSTSGFAYPTSNPVLKNFDAGAGVIGMWFSGRKGDAVNASNAGEVLYSGNGLSEYGNLIMIRHDAHYITAYAHNDQLLVQEGDSVRAGQRIATMGNSGQTNQVALQFQVRKDGTPIDPRAVLGLN